MYCVKQLLSIINCKISANATLETHISQYIASYHNTHPTRTSRTLADILLC